jgi:hypothetical protein
MNKRKFLLRLDYVKTHFLCSFDKVLYYNMTLKNIILVYNNNEY